MVLIVGLTMVLFSCGGNSQIDNDFGPYPVNTPPTVPSNGAYVGALLLTGQTTVSEFNSATGVNQAAFGEFIRFPEVLDRAANEYEKIVLFVKACRAVSAIPVITIQTFGGLDSYTEDQIQEFASMLYGFHTAMIIRWNNEMNGSWYPWGQQPIKYIERFKTFAQILHLSAPNVAMAWTPNQGWGYPWTGGTYSVQPGTEDFTVMDTNGDGALTEADDPYGPFYPGDEAVDWVGHSFYHWANGSERGYNEVPYDGKWGQINGIGNAIPNFHDIFAVGHSKPMMIAETSAFYDPLDTKGGGASEVAIKEAWIRQVYNLTESANVKLPESLPRIRMILWFSQLKPESEVGHDVDWRVHANAEIAASYQAAIADAYFLKAGSQ